uniref:Uncharacterized protein n=1 Tax=Anas platyrhynchos TaxID=8839 RepID=A0A8B9QWE6_ANAPL
MSAPPGAAHHQQHPEAQHLFQLQKSSTSHPSRNQSQAPHLRHGAEQHRICPRELPARRGRPQPRLVQRRRGSLQLGREPGELQVLEKIRSAVGSAQLLMSQKVQQFYRLCQQNMVSARPPSWGRLRLSLVGWGAAEPMLCGMTWPLLSPQDPNAFPVPTFQDLAGFWDLLQLSIEDVSMKFAGAPAAQGQRVEDHRAQGGEEGASPDTKEAAALQGAPGEGALAGLGGPAAAGGSQAAPGSQTRRLLPPKFGHRERGQHRDLHPRGADPAVTGGSLGFSTRTGRRVHRSL